MARICPLFSGSSGNCTLIGSRDGYILVDAGTSARKIDRALRERDVDPGLIAAVFVTHEHNDHISALRVFTAGRSIPVYATPETLSGIEKAGQLAGVDAHPFPTGGVSAAGMHITSFPTMHDTQGSCGYVIETADDRRIAVATDMGIVTDEVRRALKGCDLMLIESNHDAAMLEAGGYPYYLKRRILSERGHLSNDACAAELTEFAKSGTARFILGHISRENNVPELARQTSLCALQMAGMKEGLDFLLETASPAGGAVCVF